MAVWMKMTTMINRAGGGEDQRGEDIEDDVTRKHVTHPLFSSLTWVLCLYLTASCVNAQGNRRTNKRSEMLSTLIQKTPNNKVPPNFDKDHPTTVNCQIYVDSFDSISEASMDYTVSLMLAMSWQSSLNYEYEVEFLEIDSESMQKIWIPDLYFPNEKKASFHQVMNPNQMMRLYPDGMVDYFARLSLTLSCPMNLRNYPFDRQVCALRIESFGFDSSKLSLEWSDDLAVDVNEQIQLPQFQVSEYMGHKCGQRDYSRIGNHSCLEAKFKLERSLQYYIIQMYIPSTLIVIVSWLSFWLTVGSVAGRISLGVLTVLTMTTQSSSVNASLPKVSYIKAIDMWMSTCLVFVFSALIEFAIVNWLSRRNEEGRAGFLGSRGGGAGGGGIEAGGGAGVLATSATPSPRPLMNGPSTSSAAMRSTDTLDEGFRDLDTEKGTLIRRAVVSHDGRTHLMGEQSTTGGSKDPNKSKYPTSIQVAIIMDRVSRVLFPFLFGFFASTYWIYYAHFAGPLTFFDDSSDA